jgi:hypothetical protein
MMLKHIYMLQRRIKLILIFNRVKKLIFVRMENWENWWEKKGRKMK